ncbi:hypothetical protein EC973_006964 [Apophysomyces ossiformis]|uniref:Uncharacterized protein n=1 Tax=Apophysomyces ossiformis TaxID=679940 RepID=A0A8H7BMT0_9FUNG|nr:hypothetical protein EC973_006964 [Apophysomyces ossiformis]
MHPHSALQVYYFLHSVWQTFDSSEFTEFMNLLTMPRYQLPVQAMAEQLLQVFLPRGRHLESTLQSLLQVAIRNPQYDAFMVRVADSFYLIHRVESTLENDQMLENFVRSLSLDDSSATHEQVLEQLSRFRSTLNNETKTRLDAILSSERSQDDEQNTAMDEIELLLSDDPILLEKIHGFLLDGIPWSQLTPLIHDLVQARKPEIWSRLSPLLQLMQTSQETEDYASYEDYVQRNFLDDGGQQYLDSEADRACVEHMLENLSMQR